ncbi:MAG: conserved phage C-terminal domain-containing protein [Flavobacteriaceae bacterium]|nr:conserved phage C-terminal domain-containing protein [Flavobacteriaceae bacterium]
MKTELHTEEIEILNALNEITGSKFRTIKSNLTKITALLKAGFEKQDFLEVIQLKTVQWKNNPKMAGYLCPTTLFRESNFEKYYNEVQQVKANPKLYGEYFKSINKIPSSAADNDDAISELYG